MSYTEKVYTGVVTQKPMIHTHKHTTVATFVMVTDHFVLDKSGVCGEIKKEFCVVLPGSDLSDIESIIDVGSIVQVHAVSFNIDEMEIDRTRRYVDDYIVATYVLAEKGVFDRDA